MDKKDGWVLITLVTINFGFMFLAAKFLPADDPTAGRITSYANVMLTGIVTYLGIKFAVNRSKKDDDSSEE